ncbi:MAG: MFS transporter [Victivallaceae bacterium]|nr:MFS transporter [Victivallaceae bacterium]
MRNKRELCNWVLLTGAILFYFCANLQKVIIPGQTFNHMLEILHSATMVTLLATVFSFAYALLQPVAGALADRFSGIRTIAVAGAMLVLGSFGAAMTDTAWVLYASRIVTALGAAMVYVSLIQHAGTFAGDKLSIVLGFSLMMGNTGSIAGTTPFAMGLQYLGYTIMMLSIGAFILAIYIIYLLAMASAELPPMTGRKMPSLSDVIWAFSKRNVLIYFITGIPLAMLLMMLMTLGKKFLQDHCGFGSIGASNVTLAMTIITTLNVFVSAWVSRMMGNRKMPILLYGSIGTFSAVTGIAVLIATGAKCAWLVAALMCVVASTGNIAPVFVAYLKEHNHAGVFAMVVGLANTAAFLIAAVVDNLCGIMMDQFGTAVDGVYSEKSYLAVFIMLSVISAMAVVANITLFRMDRKKAEQHPDAEIKIY